MTVPAKVPTLYHPNGLPARTMMATSAGQNGGVGFTASEAYRAGDRFSQELGQWNPHLGSPDGDYLPTRDPIVARIRDLVRNNGWASGAVTRLVDQAIGATFRLSARPDWMALGQSPEWARDWSRAVEAAFRTTANDPRHYMDAAERQSVSGLLGLGFRHFFVDGEALAVAHWIPRPNFPYATAIQLIDPDRLSNPHHRMDTSRMRGGIEVNAFGAPRAYHIRNSHPGDILGVAPTPNWVRVPRRTPHGRARVLHYFEVDRAGQTRGVSRLVAAVEKLKMLDQYERTELQAAVINAVFAAFIESPFDHEMVGDAFNDVDGGVGAYQEARASFHNDRQLRLDGVRIPILFPGEKMASMKGERPNTAFADFERAVLRNVAATSGQSYEQLAQDWSETNYSSARAALLESWKFLVARRDGYANEFARGIYALWLEEAIDRGFAEIPAGAPSFWEAPAAWIRCSWIGPGRGWVDPVKEAQAASTRMDNNLSTLRDEAAEQGRDWEEVLEQRAHEAALMEELGVKKAPPPMASESEPEPEDEDESPREKVRETDDPDADDVRESAASRAGRGSCN